MSRAKELRKCLGERYSFKRWVSGQELFRLQKRPPEDFTAAVLAELIVGCVKMEAVAYLDGGRVEVGYDIFVKDSPDAREWICYDISNRAVRLKESEMLAELDRVVSASGLSYTDCCFERLDGVVITDEKKPSERPP